jgi:hypothetical protein
MDDDSTLGGLGPLTAILVVIAFALLGSLLYGAGETRRNHGPRPADGAAAAPTRARRRRRRLWRATVWMLRQIDRSFT